MSAVPLVNLTPQPQSGGTGNSAATAGNPEGAGSFENYITQAGSVQQAGGSNVQTMQTPGGAQTSGTQLQADPHQSETSGLTGLFKLFGLLFGFQKGTVQNPDSNAQNPAGELQKTGTVSETPHDLTNQSEDAPARAFEGFFSEIQKMLVLFHALVQEFSTNNVETSLAEGDQTGTQVTANQAGTTLAPDSSPASGKALQIAPGISVDETAQGQITGATQDLNSAVVPASNMPENMAASAMEQQAFPQPVAPSGEAESYSGSMGQQAVQQTLTPTGNPEPRLGNTEQQAVQQTVVQNPDPAPHSGGAKVEFYSFSYSGSLSDDYLMSAPSLSQDLAPSNYMAEVDEVLNGLPDNASEQNGLKMDVQQVFLTDSSDQGDEDAQISLLSGSIQAEGKGDSISSLDIKKLNISTPHGNLNAYAIQATSDNSDPKASGQVPSSTNQNTLVINYASITASAQTGAGNGQGRQHNSSNDQGGLDITYQNTAQTNSSPVTTGSESRVIDPVGTTGENVAAQLADGVSQAARLNKNRAVLHLNPPELGSVKVNLTVDHNNHVQASFIADHPETRHIIEANLQHLKDNLSQNGFSLTNVNVDLGGSAFADSGADPQGHHLTPFGDPAMWIENGNGERDDSPVSSYQGVSSDGVHVVI